MSFRPRLLGEATEAPPVGGDSVDGKKRRAGWRAELVNMEKSHMRTAVNTPDEGGDIEGEEEAEEDDEEHDEHLS
jgi:hypothetical protein